MRKIKEYFSQITVILNEFSLDLDQCNVDVITDFIFSTLVRVHFLPLDGKGIT